MNRTLKLPLLVALALGSTSAMALGLGHIHVKSALDQPFLADIPLTLDYPGQASHVTATLASAADFQRAGLDRSQIKAHLKFKVVTNRKGQRVIRVTSSQPVHATYLDFLVKVSWPKGSMLREFTALLDPQGMAGNQPMSGSTAGSGEASSNATARPASAATAQGQRHIGAAGSGSPAHNNQYGPVRAGETLSAIARQELPRGVTVNQMVMALYKANPDAFYRQNINALKRGAVLRIPSHDQAAAESVAAAIAAVQHQDADWTATTAGSPAMVAHAGGRSGNSQTAGGGNASGDHLALVPPKQGTSGHAQPGVAGGNGNTSASGLQQDLARTKESLSNAQQENADLQSRVSSLKSINDKNSKLLNMKSAQIAELQQKLAQARKAAGMPPVPAASVASASAAAASSTASRPAAMTASASSVATANGNAAPGAASKPSASKVPATANSANAAALASKPPVAKPSGHTAGKRHTPPPAQPVAPATPWFMRPWTWLVAAVVVIGLALLAWVSSRRRRADASPGKPSLADQFGDSPFGPDSDTVDGDESMDADQRELLAQLAENPDDVGLHLELVSLYYARSDVEHFEGAAEAMYAHISDPEQPEWQDVVAMGRELTPEHPLFAHEGEHTATPVDTQVETVTDEELDLGSYVSEQDAEDIDEDVSGDIAPPSQVNETDQTAETDGYSFDFDLTPRRASTQDQSEVPQPPTEEEYDALPPVNVDESDAGEDESILPESDDTSGERVATPVDDDHATSADETAAVSDDPVDTKLDLARAYIDMGDPEGARAMLDEVMAEGTQMQKDMASKLLDEMN